MAAFRSDRGSVLDDNFSIFKYLEELDPAIRVAAGGFALSDF
ncbi:MAG: hypothetical protein P4M07_19830 [Xanthobacteraceae bacterium]|nr:hypothetical protein [Xanthobacteraceae bacterium]